MKLTLQLVIVVLNTQKKFRDNLLKFTLHTMGSSRYLISIPPPPQGGHFSFRPLTPWNFHSIGYLSDPWPLEFPLFSNLFRHPLEGIVIHQKMLLRYTVIRKVIVFVIKRENPFIHVSRVSNNLNFLS